MIREVTCADAIPWLFDMRGELDSIITGLPDMAELDMKNPDEYVTWFSNAAFRCVEAVTPSGFAIFDQTDRRFDGAVISKAAICIKQAEIAGARLIWHKIVLRHAPGTVDFFRPSYSHLLCFSKEGKAGKATPDVIPYEKRTWKNGMALASIGIACEFVKQTVNTVYDPFCGVGSVLAVANNLGMDAYGIDIDPAMCEAARTFKLSLPTGENI